MWIHGFGSVEPKKQDTFFLLATHGNKPPFALYLGRVDTVYCGVDTGLLPHYRDPMLDENRVS